ncbi:hypothetical protein Pla144_10460 [Bythopirellula polymerisocia]|uniref:Uncharacterized protein n=1 Tax=Bythopirellula polymerisocia TaxID=2528003 RepID=A0A5C6D076_9BACT|nr:hypothetical protein Pla144_10460 [Bythopirellula polymerisocia]
MGTSLRNGQGANTFPASQAFEPLELCHLLNGGWLQQLSELRLAFEPTGRLADGIDVVPQVGVVHLFPGVCAVEVFLDVRIAVAVRIDAAVCRRVCI